MDSFEIIMTPDAESDLWELRDYLANKLLVPDVALKYVRLIRDEISSLSQMPYRIKLVDDEPWHSYGIRRIIVKNFYIYFRISTQEHKVYILNIIYYRRDQLKLLKKMEIKS